MALIAHILGGTLVQGLQGWQRRGVGGGWVGRWPAGTALPSLAVPQQVLEVVRRGDAARGHDLSVDHEAGGSEDAVRCNLFHVPDVLHVGLDALLLEHTRGLISRLPFGGRRCREC
jgi:hypothetical protein